MTFSCSPPHWRSTLPISGKSSIGYNLRISSSSLRNAEGRSRISQANCDSRRPDARSKGHKSRASFPTPENIQGVRRFLGMASYYRRFIAGIAKIAQPLHHLTAKDVPFQWAPECEAAFTELKSRLARPRPRVPPLW